jgi:hypothetical protein
MTKSQEAAINRACAHECVRQELVEALAELTRQAEVSLDYRPEFRRAIADANAALSHAKEQ